MGGEEEPILVRGLTQDLRRASSQLRALLASGRGLRAGATAWTGHPSQRQPFGTMIHNRSRVVKLLVQHWMGVEGMPRRVANYPLLPGNVTTLNIIATVGSWILALSILIFLWNIYITWRHGVKVTEEDTWGYCSSLEWATSCPPPRHNFYRIPRIRSERPAFEAHYPHIKWGRESRGIEQKIPAIGSARK